ncbi:putative nuclease HARBI1 [Photinus pyralis]|uniref:putative nuclease HARBI1 n=2 Tax=Photinus pyralis TaxID=7054 RepID=UPI001266E612|nr:putative nuclease HARBI1 [Photinus pyralis]
MDLQAIIALLVEDRGINVAIIENVALDLAVPLNIIGNEVRERNAIPRNLNYYEETIPQYLGDLFVQHFRMSRECFGELSTVIGNNQRLQNSTIPMQKKILFTLWVLAKPESFLAAGDRFGLARSTAHGIFKDVVAVFVELLNRYITWPNNHDTAIRAFHDKSGGFPGVIGAIDGCHIQMKQPTANANDYYNRKQVHSVILQGICNHKKLFMDIYVGMPGRVHDAHVLRTSPVYGHLVNNNNTIMPHNCHILGDSAYPLMENLLTPFRDNGHLNEDQIRYNVKLSTIRAVIERAFGQLKGKFRRLKYLDIAEPDFATEIITAACVLHNFTLMWGEEMHDNEAIIEGENNHQEADDNDVVADHQNGVEKRNFIVNILRH